MAIKKYNGEIINVVDLSKTAKEVTVALNEPIEFMPGSFMNVFFDINGEKIRRAYSISSSVNDKNIVQFSIRNTLNGLVSPLFWNKNMIGEKVELMGPLGVNTVDKMTHKKAHLFAFGVGVGVIKSVADYLLNNKDLEQLSIYTGNRTEDEILYKDYFDKLSKENNKIALKYVLSSPNEGSVYPKGYLQEHINDLDFNNSDVYVCGQEKACNSLIENINKIGHDDCKFFIEAFH